MRLFFGLGLWCILIDSLCVILDEKTATSNSEHKYIHTYFIYLFIYSQVAALLTLRANWFDTLTVKQWEIMINNHVLLFSTTNY